MWELLRGTRAQVTAATEGVVIAWSPAMDSSASSRFERILPALLLQLEDMEIGRKSAENNWCIPYENFIELEDKGIDAFDSICKWSPLTVELESTRWLGAPDFRYTYRFHLGLAPVAVERRGCFLNLRNDVLRLDADTFTLVQAIDEFNSTAPGDRISSALLEFSKIKGLATSIGAKLDKYIGAERVLLPSKLGVDIIAEEGGRISFVPKVEGVPQEGLTRAFFASDDIESVYAVDDDSGGRIRVIFDETQQEVLRRIQRVRHLGGKSKAEVMRDPAVLFDGVSGAVEFAFGPRVIGVGDFPFTVRPYMDARTGILDATSSGSSEPCPPEYGIECQYPDGSNERIKFSSRDDLLKFRNEVAGAEGRGIGTVNLTGKTILLTPQLGPALDELLEVQKNSKRHRKGNEDKSPGKYVLIYTNEAQLEYQLESGRVEPRGRSTSLPTTFSAKAKPHQSVGYEWLRTNYDRSRSGCLLADDMGLGKTLQVLLFIAHLIESGDISGNKGSADLPPWNPILIVTPVILIENATWETDMQEFFSEDGSVFEPLLVLHGATIKRFRSPSIQGREIGIGQAALLLGELRKYKVILTNYETVVNYQHSFARIPWSLVVTDEAQEYKTPSTKVSHAMKALTARFRIACTGTPVETKLFDIWNLFDFLQPGPLLGSATDFRGNYEPSVQDCNLPKLKERLKLGASDAHLLRRNKADVLVDLPPKYEHYLESKLSQTQVDWHIDLLDRRSGSKPESHPFSILDSLMKVSQHPALVPRFEPTTPAEAIHNCPKLESVIQCLREIRLKREKALIFARSTTMQQLLALTLEHVFKFPVHIVNGATGKDVRRGVNNSRRSIVDAFRKSIGFNVLILSPDVAGIGLTIVEANHVIHYGRWWNPAKESQATDRVYRIGQTKPVHVYYPVSKHPEGTFPSFDEKLDALLTKRKKLAADFLAPMPDEEELQSELLRSLGVSGESIPPQQLITIEDLSKMTWDRFESLVALIEEKYGRNVWLSPKSGDGGIDVVAQLGSEIRLIQCKHSQWAHAIDNEVLAELISSSDAFRASVHLTGYTIKPVLITNSTVPRKVLKFGHDRDVEVISITSFDPYLGRLQCSRAEVEVLEQRRYPSIARLKQDLIGALRRP